MVVFYPMHTRRETESNLRHPYLAFYRCRLQILWQIRSKALLLLKEEEYNLKTAHHKIWYENVNFESNHIILPCPFKSNVIIVLAELTHRLQYCSNKKQNIQVGYLEQILLVYVHKYSHSVDNKTKTELTYIHMLWLIFFKRQQIAASRLES